MIDYVKRITGKTSKLGTKARRKGGSQSRRRGGTLKSRLRREFLATPGAEVEGEGEANRTDETFFGRLVTEMI